MAPHTRDDSIEAGSGLPVRANLERERLILSLAPAVSFIAHRFSRLFGPGWFADLESAAWLGAILAVDRFDANRGATLASFAQLRIRGSIQDYLRGIDPLTRKHRKGLVGDGVPIVICHLRSEDPQHEGLVLILPDLRADRPQQEFDAHHDTESLFRLAHLTARDENIIRRHYCGDESMKSLGLSLGICESRISQICAAGLKKLRAAANN